MKQQQKKLLPADREREWASRMTKQRLSKKPLTAAPRANGMFMSTGCYRSSPTSKD